MNDNAIKFLKDLFEVAVRRADPRKAGLLPLGPKAPKGKTVVVGAGKASAAFASALEDTCARLGRKIDEGLVICPYGTAMDLSSIECHEASHPVPDAASLKGAKRILELASGLGPDDELIVLLSGGGSSLMALPAEGITLGHKMAVTDQLLKCGAPIGDINCVRKHLSAIKGGKLARAAAPARVTALAISDVVGNDPAIIASGPTVVDRTTPKDALTVLTKYNLDIPKTVRALLDRDLRGPDEGILSHKGTLTLVATPEMSLAAAIKHAKEFGPPDLQIHDLGCEIEGEAEDVARRHARHALALKSQGSQHLIVSGGELTCHLPGDLDLRQTEGGPNHVYALTLLRELKGEANIYVLAADTDGKDGSTSAAGASFGPEDWQRARALDISPEEALASHRSGIFFEQLGNQLVTGPTHTNVNDFRAILITESETHEKG